MNIEIIANQFETRAGTLLRYFTDYVKAVIKCLSHSRYTMIHLILCI